MSERKVKFFSDKIPLPIEKSTIQDSEKIVLEELDHKNFMKKKGFYQR